MTTEKAIHEGCGGIVEISDDGACDDPECCGNPAFYMECLKCSKRID